jgi:hypothetical protein
MNASTPSNPFPSDAVVKNSIEQLPDFRETNSYHRAVVLVENFRENFSLATSGGMAMGIRGRFGSGKTHLIFQLIKELRASTALQSMPMYAKADKADFLDFYVNHFAGKIDLGVLRKAVSLHLAKLHRVNSAAPGEETTGGGAITIGEAMARTSGEKSLVEIAQEEVDRRIATDPVSILDLVQQDLLPVSGLNQKLDEEIEKTARSESQDGQNATDAVADVSRDFFRAYSKVTDRDLGSIAARWIQGGQLSNAEQLDLGLLSAAINQAASAKQAMRFLLAAFKKADFAVMFCVDEFERFSSRGTADDLNASAGLLKDLAETFQETGHLLVVSGENGAWNAMKRDVFARIVTPNIIEMSLSQDEARGLLDAYCRSSKTSLESVFEAKTFQLLYEASNYNTRRLLELAHESYELATKSTEHQLSAEPALPVKDQHVKQAADNLLSDSKRRETVEQAIQSVALDMNLPFRRQVEIDGTMCDYVLGDERSLQVAIEITQSIFKLSELSSAREIATASQAVHRNNPQLRFCVVIVGYSTRQVRDELARVVDRVFAFDEESFTAEFRGFLQGVASQPREMEQRLASQAAAYEGLVIKFDQLERARRDEISELKEALERLETESRRERETEREKRVTDKMGDTLNALSDLLEREERYALRNLSREGKDEPFIPTDAKQDLVFRLIDEQIAYVRRAEILNERLPQAVEFSMRLMHLMDLLRETGSLWRRAHNSYGYRDKFFLSDINPDEGGQDARELYRDRKRLISELEGLHYRRASFEGGVFGKFGQAIRQNKIVGILSALAIIGFVLALYSLYSGWSKERSAITYSSVQLSQIQYQVRLVDLDPSKLSDQSDNVTPTLLQIAVSLETVPFGKTYVVSRVLSGNIPVIRTEILMLREVLEYPNSERDWEKIKFGLERISSQSSRLQQQLDAISFSTFSLTYISANRWWFIVELLPAALLVYFLLLKALRNRLRRLRLRRRLEYPG